MSSLPAFSERSLRFLRALKRNNRREWFHERRADYDTHLHAPMVAIVEQLAATSPGTLRSSSPCAKISMFRPWRDTRFSADKTPLKTHVAAVFPHRALGTDARRRPLLRGGAAARVDRRRALRARYRGAARGADAHRGAPSAADAAAGGAGVQEATRRDARRADDPHAARIRRRPPRRRRAAPQAVPGVAGGAGGVRHAAGLLQGAPRDVPGDGAVRPLPERTVDRRQAGRRRRSAAGRGRQSADASSARDASAPVRPRRLAWHRRRPARRARRRPRARPRRTAAAGSWPRPGCSAR